jgi:transposase
MMLPVSNDTLLRVVRQRARMPTEQLRVIGIDDFAWRRNHRYGTIVCDLERRRPVVILPDREPATSEAWLKQQPVVHTVARDRGGGYGEAVARALPKAEQVADRWHLMENASRAFLDAVRKSMRQIRRAIGATVINPVLLTAAEKLQYEGYLRREEMNAAVLALWQDGCRSSRSSSARAITARPSGGSSAANAATSSDSGRVRWMRTCPGSMRNGMRELEMQPLSGAR